MNTETKAELIERIKTIEGLTDDVRSSLLELLKAKKPYGLVWENKTEDVEERLRDQLPVLTEVAERAIISDNPDVPNHILIEGDNLEALTTLAYTHAGKIDVIYIDPPYNTGNKDFIYNDSFVDSENAYRHSMWLSFMSKRLRIAKKLLSDRGVIFISIDDNEQANLKMLCDDKNWGFGEDRFIGQIVWFKKRKGSFLSNKLISLTEYILAYSKKQDIHLFGGLPSNTESQPIIKRTNAPKVLSFPPKIVKTKLADGIYQKGIYGKGSSASELLEDINVSNGYITSPMIIKAPFVWSQEFLESEIKKGTEIIVNTKNFQVRVIRHNNESTKALASYIDGREESATNEDAYELLKEIFAVDRPFQYSKPVNLVKKLILSNSYSDKNSTILDFFAGSGTTMHAVMQLNAEDGGHRQCILVTNNENGICENVTYERNKRVINGYTKPNGEAVEGLHDNNLRYYRTMLLEKNNTHQNRRALFMALTDVLCFKEDIYHEENKFGHLSLKGKSKMLKYFTEHDRQMLMIYDSRVIPFIVKEIGKMGKTDNPIKIFIFADGTYPYSEDFKGVLDKIELIAMPYAFTHAIKDCIPQQVDQPIDQTELSEQEQAELLAEAAETEKK